MAKDERIEEKVVVYYISDTTLKCLNGVRRKEPYTSGFGEVPVRTRNGSRRFLLGTIKFGFPVRELKRPIKRLLKRCIRFYARNLKRLTQSVPVTVQRSVPFLKSLIDRKTRFVSSSISCGIL